MFFTLLLSFALIGSPDSQFKAALADVSGPQVAPESRRVTRYLDLSAIPPENHQSFLVALIVAINSTSTSSRFFRPVLVGDLLRLDLSALGWDKDFRAEEIRRLAAEGVSFRFRDARTQAAFIDIWEDIGAADPYFRVTYGQRRGWIDPHATGAARLLTESNHLVLRADWFLPRILLEAKDFGYYSQLLLLPTSEVDLYRRFGTNIKTIERFNQLRHGAAVIGPSIVARHNRELQEIPNSFGDDVKVTWRTFDFAKGADDPRKNVLRALGGTAVHEGREIIGTLPNGLHWYYLSDGRGTQVNVVPQAVALDQRDKRGISDPNVTNAIKCMDCHMPVSGIYPFRDRTRALIVAPDIALAVIAKGRRLETQFIPVVPLPVEQDPLTVMFGPAERPRLKIKLIDPVDPAIKALVAVKAKDLEEYYLADLDARVARQQESYGRHLTACGGRSPVESAAAIMAAYNTYHEDLVHLEQAARELGATVPEAISLLRASGNQDLVILSSDPEGIRREVWEQGFADAAKVPIYPWEQPLKIKPKY